MDSNRLSAEQVRKLADDLNVADGPLLEMSDVLPRALELINTRLVMNRADVRGNIHALLSNPQLLEKLAAEFGMTVGKVRKLLEEKPNDDLETLLNEQAVADALGQELKHYPNRAFYAYRLPHSEQRDGMAGYISFAAAEQIIQRYTQKNPLAPESARAVQKLLQQDIRGQLLLEDEEEDDDDF